MASISEEQFTSLVQIYNDPNVSNEEKSQYEKYINLYREQQAELGLSLTPKLDEQFKLESENNIKENINLFSGLDKLSPLIPNELKTVFDVSDNNRALYANKKLLGKIYENADYDSAKYTYFRDFGIKDLPKDEISFYEILKNKVNADEKERIKSEKSSLKGFDFAVKGIDYNSAIKSAQAELGEDFDLAKFSKEYNERASLLSPYKADIDTFLSDMSTFMNNEATEKEQNRIKGFSQKLTDLNPTERRAVLSSLYVRAKELGENNASAKNFLQEGFESFGRIYSEGLAGGGSRFAEKALEEIPTKGSVITSVPEIKNIDDARKYVNEKVLPKISEISSRESAGAMFGEPLVIPTVEGGVQRELTQEETTLIEKAIRKSQKEISIGREIRNIGTSLDPIRDNWLSISASTLGSTAAILPMSIAPGGVVLGSKIYADMEYNSLRSKYPTMSVSDAENISMISGAIQGGLDKLNINFIKRGLPNLSKIISGESSVGTAILKRFVKNAAGVYVFENLVEGAQDISTAAVQGVFNALKKDVPEVNWDDELKEWIDTRVDVAIGMIPLVLLGAGGVSYADKVNVDKVLKDDYNMRNLGISEERRGEILSLVGENKTDEARKILQIAYKERVRENKTATVVTDNVLENAQNLGIIPTILKRDNSFVVRDPNAPNVLENEIVFNSWKEANEYINTTSERNERLRAENIKNALLSSNLNNLAEFADTDVERENLYNDTVGSLDGLTKENLEEIRGLTGKTSEESLTNSLGLVNDIGIIDSDSLEVNPAVVSGDEIVVDIKERTQNAVRNFIRKTISNLSEITKAELDKFTNNKLEDTLFSFIVNGQTPNTANKLFNGVLRQYNSSLRSALGAIESVAAISKRKGKVAGAVKPSNVSETIKAKAAFENRLIGTSAAQASFTERIRGKRLGFILNPPKKYFKLLSKLNDKNLSTEERTSIENQISNIMSQETLRKGSLSYKLKIDYFNKLLNVFNSSSDAKTFNENSKALLVSTKASIDSKKAILDEKVKSGEIKDRAIVDLYFSRIETSIGAIKGMMTGKVSNKDQYNLEFIKNNFDRYLNEVTKVSNLIDDILEPTNILGKDLNIVRENISDYFETTEEILNSNRFTVAALEDVIAMLETLGIKTDVDVNKIKNFESIIRDKISVLRNKSEEIFKDRYLSNIDSLVSLSASVELTPENKKIVEFIKEYYNKSAEIVKDRLISLESRLYPKDFKKQLDSEAFKNALIEYNVIKNFGNIKDKSFRELVESDKALGAIWNGKTTEAVEAYTSEIDSAIDSIKSEFATDKMKNKAEKRKDYIEGKKTWKNAFKAGSYISDLFSNLSNSVLTFKSITNLLTNGNKLASDIADGINNGMLANQDSILEIADVLDTELDYVRNINLGTKSSFYTRLQRRQFLFDISSISSENKISVDLFNNDGSIKETRKITQAFAAYILNIYDQTNLRGSLEKKGINAETIKQIRKGVDPRVELLRNRLKKRIRESFQKSNKVYREMNGYSASIDPDFYPVRMEYSGAPSLLDPFSIQQQAGGQRMGFDNRVLDFNESLDLDFDSQDVNLVSMYNTHSYETAYWRNLIKPLSKAKIVYNNSDIKELLKNTYGQGAIDEINEMINAFESGGIFSGFINKTLGKYVTKATGGFAKAALGYKLSTFIVNMSSAANTLLDSNIPVGQALKSYTKVVTGNSARSYSDVWNSQAIQRRVSSGANSLIALSKAKSSLDKPKWYDEFVDFSVGSMSYADALGGSLAAAAAFDAHYTALQKSDPLLSKEELESAAFDKMMETINKTFQPSILSGKSTYEMNSNPIMRFFTLFQSEARKSLGLEIEALRDSNLPWQTKVRIVAVNHLLFGGLIWSLKSAIRDYADDEDDEIFDEKNWNLSNFAINVILGPLSSAPILGSVGEFLIGSTWNMFLETIDPDLKKAKIFSTSDNILEKGVGNIMSGFKGVFEAIEDSEQPFEDSIDEVAKIMNGIGTVIPISVFGLLSVGGNLADQTVDYSKPIIEAVTE